VNLIRRVLNKWFRIREPIDRGDVESNLIWNRHAWGNLSRWRGVHRYGYQWDGIHEQLNSDMATIAVKYLHPYLNGRTNLVILEIAPGAGRFTTELVRLSNNLHLVDLNPACIQLCRERFRYYPLVEYHLNDGRSLSGVSENAFDLIACYDAAVHMAPEVIRGYVFESASKLTPGGILWIDHSGKGEKKDGHRTDMTDARMRDFASEAGLSMVDQQFRNDHDCISVLRKPR
jgi:2-polyprenyl-3-methyl-5-hydroxy-6-metoxy-1,4-benzoquinol methylase